MFKSNKAKALSMFKGLGVGQALRGVANGAKAGALAVGRESADNLRQIAQTYQMQALDSAHRMGTSLEQRSLQAMQYSQARARLPLLRRKSKKAASARKRVKAIVKRKRKTTAPKKRKAPKKKTATKKRR